MWMDAAGPSLSAICVNAELGSGALLSLFLPRVSRCTEATSPKKSGRLVESSGEREGRRKEEEEW